MEMCPMNSENISVWRGDVYYADLGENKGSVQSGVRPVVIIQNNTGNHEGPTLIVVPISSQIKKLWLPVHVWLSKHDGLLEDSMALCEQIQTIDKSQLMSYICRLKGFPLTKVNVGSLISLGFMPVKREKEYLQRSNEMILCLCGEHLRPYLYDKEYKVERLNHFQNKDQCTCCEKMGYDYRVTHITLRQKSYKE